MANKTSKLEAVCISSKAFSSRRTGKEYIQHRFLVEGPEGLEVLEFFGDALIPESSVSTLERLVPGDLEVEETFYGGKIQNRFVAFHPV